MEIKNLFKVALIGLVGNMKKLWQYSDMLNQLIQAGKKKELMMTK
jgi:hypothetical protein